jgi:hypothetical protein
MAQSTMRGMRLGTQSLESEKGVAYSERATHIYRCANEHDTQVVFAAEAELPQTWQCKQCALEGTLLEDGKKVTLDANDDKTPRSHWEMLLERRTREELEEILQERLEYIRARRKAGEADI